MSSNNKRRLLDKIFKTSRGCGCGRPKLSDVIQPKPKPTPKASIDSKSSLHHSSSSSWERSGCGHSVNDDDEDYTSTTFSLNINTPSSTLSPSQHENDPNCSQTVSPCPKICNSVAVVKDSDDPYVDFRQSMLQMILEKGIYSKGDLQKLLILFLQLNSPSHHQIIVQAFVEIWNGMIESRKPGIDSEELGVRQRSSGA
ncbi:hypothetical protein RJ639_016658 [Escallonia herrerae]|uniref:Transcription repressor n=1 Tax=Escallonia herrerae TaxID=1293975 RepID=A0AA88VF33_9ASTE|nr:hypothetical protein RJ639_016658 [Escallonia herrerae]